MAYAVGRFGGEWGAVCISRTDRDGNHAHRYFKRRCFDTSKHQPEHNNHRGEGLEHLNQRYPEVQVDSVAKGKGSGLLNVNVT